MIGHMDAQDRVRTYNCYYCGDPVNLEKFPNKRCHDLIFICDEKKCKGLNKRTGKVAFKKLRKGSFRKCQQDLEYLSELIAQAEQMSKTMRLRT